MAACTTISARTGRLADGRQFQSPYWSGALQLRPGRHRLGQTVQALGSFKSCWLRSSREWLTDNARRTCLLVAPLVCLLSVGCNASLDSPEVVKARADVAAQVAVVELASSNLPALCAIPPDPGCGSSLNRLEVQGRALAEMVLPQRLPSCLQPSGRKSGTAALVLFHAASQGAMHLTMAPDGLAGDLATIRHGRVQLQESNQQLASAFCLW